MVFAFSLGGGGTREDRSMACWLSWLILLRCEVADFPDEQIDQERPTNL